MTRLHKNDYVYSTLEMIKIIDHTINAMQHDDNIRSYKSEQDIKQGICSLIQCQASILFPTKNYYCSNLHNLLIDHNPKKDDTHSYYYPYWFPTDIHKGGISKRISLLIDMKVEVLHAYSEGAE